MGHPSWLRASLVLLVLVVVSTAVLLLALLVLGFQGKLSPTAEDFFGTPEIPLLNGQMQRTASGLGYIDEKVGDGASPQTDQQVTVHYTGWLNNGKKFDSSRDRGQPFVFQLGVGQVIAGLDEGVAGMKVGGKRRLIIPPSLGYGARGLGATIPPDSTLIFDVELLGVQ